ncbi:Major facilitator superfamily MFS_1 (fragment) [Nostocoides japonicum T1-X7]|uniref:Major facilitator superfamily MFS_1 n=1 Tax=Nostocoides japonicum T1-X7 TaxID=1194083 RepID=A0A077LVN7_9MICO
MATAAIGVATAVWQVAVLRALAWVSRGLRSPARDTLLTDLSRRGAVGRAFGVERAGDNLGAIVGPLLAAVLVGTLGIRHTILLSIVPGMLAAVAITVAAREARRTLVESAARRRLSLGLGALHRAGVTRVLVPLACFELGNLATTLLILRATDLLAARPGWPPSRAASVAVLLYAAHNAVAALAALLAGALADTRGPRLVLVTAAVSYVVGYALLAVGPRGAGLVAAFLLAGCGIGLGETASSTAVALATPEPLRGNAFGALGLTQAVGDLGATVVAGALWAWLGPGVAFGYAGAWMVFAVITSGYAGVARATPRPA